MVLLLVAVGCIPLVPTEGRLRVASGNTVKSHVIGTSNHCVVWLDDKSRSTRKSRRDRLIGAKTCKSVKIETISIFFNSTVIFRLYAKNG